MEYRLAKNADEKMAAYRLRYEVLFQECGDERYADHDAKVYLDRNDSGNTRLIVAVADDGTLAGTVRVTLRREAEFLRDEMYAFDTLADRLCFPREGFLHTLALMDRLAVHPAWRQAKVYPAITAEVEQLARGAGCRILLAATSESNHRVQSLLTMSGWTRYAVAGDAWRGVMFYKELAKAGDDRAL